MRQNIFQYFILLLCFGLGELSLDHAYTQEVSKPKPVKVATPQRGKIERKITYTGNLEADAMLDIFANTPGKLTVLSVNEGALVNKGDVLAETDSRELHLALKQAQASLKVAEAQLSIAKATAQIKIEVQAETAHASLDAAKAQLAQALALSEAQGASQLKQATAAVTATEASLKKALKGARNQEVLQAKAAVSGAKATLENAQANFQRVQTLYEKEAISDQNFDNAKAQLDTAKAQHASVVEQFKLVEEGARQEDITAAEAQLHQAQASLALARLTVDTQDWNTQITMAESQVRQAEANLRTASELVKIEAWNHDIAAAEAQFDQAKQQVNLAQKRFDDATITSPVNGIVVKQDSNIGDYATSGPGGSPVLTIVKMDIVKVVFTIPEADLSNVAVGTPVSISTRQHHTSGKINFVSPIVNPETRTVEIKAEMPNPEYRLKPGMFVEVSIDFSTTDDSLLLPRDAVLDIQNKVGHVFIATDGRAHKQTVKVGLAWGEKISILEGVIASTPIIVSGHQQLADGTEILIMK